MTRNRRYVVSRLRGGLGNQIFQYAVATNIARIDGREVVLDDLALGVDPPGTTPRRYYLDAFRIHASLTSRNKIELGPLAVQITQRVRGFHQELLAPCPFTSLYLAGFWQDERYCMGIVDVLREQFSVVPGRLRGPWVQAVADAGEAIAVHVRRQDYLAAPGQRLGFVGIEYYERAFNFMAAAIRKPHFFVFSDDPDWCRLHMQPPGAYSFVSHEVPGDHTVADFWLMSLCAHFIVANSTFSWWPAWLSANPDKIVVAPKRWFTDGVEESADLAPPGWTRL
jgi:hypothetical protein